MHACKTQTEGHAFLCLMSPPLLLAKVTQSQFLNTYVSLVIPVYSISAQFLYLIVFHIHST